MQINLFSDENILSNIKIQFAKLESRRNNHQQ